MPKIWTNPNRVARITRTLKLFDEPGEPGVIDLLADLRHYCDAHKLDFANLDRIAYGHYTAEVGEARTLRVSASRR